MSRKNLAYYDTLFSGLVPCRVVAFSKGRNPLKTYLKIVITKDHNIYKAGEEISNLSEYQVVPRKSITIRHGQYRIMNNYQWVMSLNGSPEYEIIS